MQLTFASPDFYQVKKCFILRAYDPADDPVLPVSTPSSQQLVVNPAPFSGILAGAGFKIGNYFSPFISNIDSSGVLEMGFNEPLSSKTLSLMGITSSTRRLADVKFTHTIEDFV